MSQTTSVIQAEHSLPIQFTFDPTITFRIGVDDFQVATVFSLPFSMPMCQATEKDYGRIWIRTLASISSWIGIAAPITSIEIATA